MPLLARVGVITATLVFPATPARTRLIPTDFYAAQKKTRANMSMPNPLRNLKRLSVGANPWTPFTQPSVNGSVLRDAHVRMDDIAISRQAHLELERSNFAPLKFSGRRID